MMLLLRSMRKDLLAYAKTLCWIPFYILLFPLFFRQEERKAILYITVTFSEIYIWITSVLAYDEANQAERIAAVLPVRTSTVILGKVLTADVVFLTATLLCALIGAMSGVLPVQIYNIPTVEEISTAFFLSGACVLLLMPACYKWGCQKSRILLVLIFGAMFAVIVFFAEILGLETSLPSAARLPKWGVIAAAVLLSALCQWLAWRLSLRIIANRT